MVKEKLKLVKQILEYNVEARGDGYGIFLNIIADTVYSGRIDFRRFNVESWTRARRKVMEKYPHLDNRTNITDEAEAMVRGEMS